MSSTTKKVLHTAAVGCATGMLTYLSGLVVGQPIPGTRVLVLSLLVAGISRAAGALLARSSGG